MVNMHLSRHEKILMYMCNVWVCSVMTLHSWLHIVLNIATASLRNVAEKERIKNWVEVDFSAFEKI